MRPVVSSLGLCVGRYTGDCVTDLPDVLLPEGQYLDLFDVKSDHSGVLSK